RGELALDRKDRIVGMSAGEEVEDIDRSRERRSAHLERVDGVGEGRRGRVAGNGRDLGRVRGKRARKGRPEMLGLDPIEGRYGEATAPVLEQWVVGGFGGRDFGLLIHAPHMGCERVQLHLKRRAGPKHVSIAAYFEFFRCERGAAKKAPAGSAGALRSRCISQAEGRLPPPEPASRLS